MRWRRQLCRGLIGVLLFAQWAVAAYACPGLATMAQQSSDSAVAAPRGDVVARTGSCDGMGGQFDPAAPNLCAEHCKAGQQSDQTPTLDVPAPVLHGLYAVALRPVSAGLPHAASASTGLFAAAAPPHSILHCCFRI